MRSVLLWVVCALLCAALALCLTAEPLSGPALGAALWLQDPAAARALSAAPAPTAAPLPAAVTVPVPTAAPSPSPTSVPTPTPTDAPLTADIEDPGTIVAQQIAQGSGEGYITLAAGSIKNATDLPDSDLRAAATAGQGSLPFTVELNSAEPQVLILHTHATECYQPWEELYFDPAFAARSQSTALNMCAVGARMAEILNAAGVNTLHDTTLHDSPSYTESYARSAETARAYLERYPSIKVILDVHRDALGTDTTRIKPLCRIDGEDTAQVMIIAGCDNGTTVQLPNWRLNLQFAAAWEATMEGMYPGLTRPVLCGYRFYNQDITTGSLLIEIGGHANTLPEALRAGQYAAEALAALLAGTG